MNNKLKKIDMNKEEIELVCEAIDFYNLNHFKGEKTKKQLVSVKKRLRAINFTGSSLELKDKNTMTFEEYKKMFYDTYFIDYYKSKKTKNLFDEKDLIKKYENYTKPLIT